MQRRGKPIRKLSKPVLIRRMRNAETTAKRFEGRALAAEAALKQLVAPVKTVGNVDYDLRKYLASTGGSETLDLNGIRARTNDAFANLLGPLRAAGVWPGEKESA